MTEFCCPYCPKKFAKNKYLWSHKNRVHKDSLQEERMENLAKEEQRKATHSFSCSECEWTGPSIRRLNAHLKSNHRIPGADENEGNGTHVCTECEAEFSTMGLLRQHADDLHGKTIQEKEFSNWDAFMVWRRDLETLKCISFVKYKGIEKRKTGETVSSFYCSNSGQHFDHAGTGKKPNRPSKRVGFLCTVFLTASPVYTNPNIRPSTCKFWIYFVGKYRTALDGSVKVRYCDSHNHEPMPQTLRMPPEVKESVADRLREGLKTKQILDKMREDMAKKNDGKPCWLSSKDINNVRSQENIFPGRWHKEDLESVRIFVGSEQRKEEKNSVICYSNAVDEYGNGLQLGLMTENMERLLREHGSNGVCLDATHNTTCYQFKLVTLLVADERQTGRPAAVFICQSESETELQTFFEAIKKRLGGPVSAKFFMSDNAPAYWNAWKSAMGPEATDNCQKLLCSWHVKRNLFGNLVKVKDDDLKRYIMVAISDVMRTTQHSLAQEKIIRLVEHLESKNENEYASYFTTNYVFNGKEREWVPSASPDALFRTNMFLERYHRTLKHGYLERSENKRLDETVFFVWKACQDSYVTSKISAGRMLGGFRDGQNHDRHRRAVADYENKKREIRCLENGSYLVESAQDPLLWHTVKPDKPCSCLNSCKYATCGVCCHEFTCSCADSVRAGFACKHIHALKMLLNEEAGISVSPCHVAVEPFTVDDPEPTLNLSASSTQDSVASSVQNIHAKISAFQKVIKTVARLAENATDDALSAALELQKNCKEVLALNQSVKVRQMQPRPDASTSGLPQNIKKRKAVLKQRRNEKKRREAENDANIMDVIDPNWSYSRGTLR